MRFSRNAVFADEVGTRYGNRLGEYVETFTSDSGQVSAELFKQDGELVAHVSFVDGISGQTATDSYLGALSQRATQLGFENKLRIVYSGM